MEGLGSPYSLDKGSLTEPGAKPQLVLSPHQPSSIVLQCAWPRPDFFLPDGWEFELWSSCLPAPSHPQSHPSASTCTCFKYLPYYPVVPCIMVHVEPGINVLTGHHRVCLHKLRWPLSGNHCHPRMQTIVGQNVTAWSMTGYGDGRMSVAGSITQPSRLVAFPP